MNGFTHVNQKISKLLLEDYAAYFGSDSYIGQIHRHCPNAFNHEFLYTSASYELKGGSSRPLPHMKDPPKMPTYVWNSCFQKN